jgi:cell division transport system permease protein
MALKLDYVSRETLINLRRNLLLTTASMVTVAVSLSMVGVAFLLQAGVDNATQRWKNGVQFEVFLNLDATPDQKDSLARDLSRNPNVKTFKFVGREEQDKLFRQYFHDQPEYLENVRADDLPESYRVVPKVEDAAVISTMADQAERMPGVNKVAFPGDEVKDILDTSRALQIAMFVIAFVLFLASSLLIFNTIRMAIFARRREIEVMKLVGATNWFIRVPFMIEGLAQGLMGAFGAVLGIYFLKDPLSRWIVEHLADFPGFFVDRGDALAACAIIAAIGAVIGAASAGVAVTRFLDV